MTKKFRAYGNTPLQSGGKTPPLLIFGFLSTLLIIIGIFYWFAGKETSQVKITAIYLPAGQKKASRFYSWLFLRIFILTGKDCKKQLRK